METLFKRYASALMEWRWAALAICLLLTLGLMSQIPHVVVDNNPDIWSPSQDEYVKVTKELEKTFGGRHFTIIGIVPKSGSVFNEATLGKARRIEQQIAALPEAVKVNVLSLTSTKVKDVRGTDGGIDARPFVGPTGTPINEADMVAALQRNPVYVNSLVSGDGKAIAVIGDFKIDGEYTPLYEKLRKIVDAERDASVTLFMSGEPVLSAGTEKAMENLPKYFAMAFGIIALVQLYGFRSAQGMFLPLLTAVLSVLWTMGALGAFGAHIDPLSSTTPILIMAVATGHSIQILKRYYEEFERLQVESPVHSPKEANKLAVMQALVKLGPVTLMSGLIGALSFLSLAFSDTAVIKQFGIFAGTGVVMVVLLEFSLIPIIRSFMPAPRARKANADLLSRGLTALGQLLKSRRGAMTIAASTTLVLVVLSAGVMKLRVYNSFLEYYPPDSETRQSVNLLNEKFGGSDSITFLIEADRADGIKDPVVLKAMSALQQRLSQRPEVGKTVSIADVVARLNQAVNNEDQAFNKVPESQAEVSQYLLLYSMSGGVEDFNSLVDSSYRKAVIRVFLKSDDTANARRVCEESMAFLKEKLPPGVTGRVGGGLAESIAINDSVVKTKQTNILQMVAVVFILSSLVFRSIVAGLLVAVPLLAILVVNLGFMGWLGFPLDMGTATVVAMVIGIGADYEIYMLSRLKEEYERCGDLPTALAHSLTTSGKAVLLVALSIAGGYAALLLSDFGFYPRLATTMMATMIASGLLSLVLLRAVIGILKPRFLMRDAVEDESEVVRA
jgi:predicted RND superfamily exporter protein